MKTFWTTYLKSFFFIALAFLLVAGAVAHNLGITYGYVKVLLGALLAAGFVAAGIRLYRRRKGNGIVNAVLGLLATLPAVVVMRVVFSLAVFRFSFVVFAVAGLAALSYAVGVFVVSTRARREAAALNELLPKTPEPPVSE
jgi:hypothetical protein